MELLEEMKNIVRKKEKRRSDQEEEITRYERVKVL